MTATLQPNATTVNDAAAQDEQTIRGMIEAWRRALEAKDLDGLVADSADDIVLYDIQPPYKIQGPAAIRAVWEQCLPCFPKAFRSEHRDLKIVVSGDVAFCYGLHRIVPIDEPDHPAGKSWLRITVCYQRIDGRWRSVHEHVSLPFDCAAGTTAPITDADL